MRVPVETLEGGEFRTETGRHQLEEALRPGEILQPVLIQVDQRDRVGQGVADERLRRLRHQDLPPVPDGEDAGDAIDGGTEVVGVALLRVPGVQRHPHPEHAGVAPRLVGERPLTGDGGLHGLGRHREGGADGVADRLEDDAAMGLDRLAQQSVVASQGRGHGLGQLLPALGGTLDVREEERDRP